MGNVVKQAKTDRGFGVVSFKDHNGVECSIQQSSAIDMDSADGVDHPGSSFIWLGCNAPDPQYLVPGQGWQPIEMPPNSIANTRMHLGREDVKMLIGCLQEWLATGTFGDDDDILDSPEIDG